MPHRIDTYNRYGRGIKNLLLLAGLWPVVNPSVFYRLVPYVHVSAELWLIWAVLNFARLHMRNFELLIKGLGLGLGFLISAQKVIQKSNSATKFFSVVINIIRNWN